MKKLQIVTKIANYIYVHHKGQFLHFNYPPKIQTAKGDMTFANVNQEMIYSLENSGQNCSTSLNHDLDGCITNVSSTFLPYD